MQMLLAWGHIADFNAVGLMLMLLMVGTLYVSVVVSRQPTGDTELGMKRFANGFGSMYTLVMTGTLMDGSSIVASELGKLNLIFGATHFLFVLISDEEAAMG